MSTETFGDYELHELLGRGGMGEVHRAYDTVRKRTVALKRLPVSLARDEAFRRRFRTEAEVAARLTEPHVLPVHDYGEIDGRLYLDMRHVEGPDLGSLLAKHGPLGPDEAVDVVGQVAAALDAAHADELVHRDVKPSNVLITLDENERPAFAYLTDFGVAQIGGADTGLSTTNATAGTVDYMAPERYTSRRTDRMVDVYSLGCVLHEALTGDKPFPAASMPEAMHAHLYLEPPRASEGRDGVPTALDEVVAVAMAKDPADRYATCGALASAARAALQQGVPQADVATAVPASAATEPVVPPAVTDPMPSPAVPAPGGPPPPLTARRRPRRRLALAAGAVAACALGAVAVVPFASAGTTTTTPPAAAPAPARPVQTQGWAATPAVAATVADGAFTGRTSGNEVTVALATKGGHVAAYLCDGKKVEAWFQGTVSGTTVHLTSGDGSLVDADLSADSALGTMTVDGRTLPFSAERSAPPAGLYEASSGSAKIGWIVLANGKQVGILQDGATASPAPALDPATMSTVVDGRPVGAARVEPGGAAW
ncbi:serine/threonine-protein kinase [Actinomycetospora sp. TBRC 11914]|uniref:serine/threonine-protein kinase n=1 Tax=Actinomycetospora sp. TBRC 11914 TaxID=2729387 RepID=UPI00289C784C|nr:serine/threonine-protein kinase [Actinomycetospora sp. TBRC 11914]